MRNSNFTMAAAAIAFAVLTYPAQAAAESWFACKGSVSTTPPNATSPTKTEPSSRTLVADVDKKELREWRGEGVASYVLPGHTFSPEKIVWGSGSWSGTLDRTNMTLTMTRNDEVQGHLAWTEKCESIKPKRSSVTMPADEP
jgi:hypothetical protein